jgi:hypothetical protein
MSIVPLASSSSQICVAYDGIDPDSTAHLSVSIIGYLSNDGPKPDQLPPSFVYDLAEVPGPGLSAIAPLRVLDTRGEGNVVSKVTANSVTKLNFANRVDVNATSVVLNVTVVDPDADGYATVYRATRHGRTRRTSTTCVDRPCRTSSLPRSAMMRRCASTRSLLRISSSICPARTSSTAAAERTRSRRRESSTREHPSVFLRSGRSRPTV